MFGMSKRLVLPAVALALILAAGGAWLLRPHDTVAGCETAVSKQIDESLAAGRDAPEPEGLPECDGLSDQEAQEVADRVVEEKLGKVFGG